MTGLTNAQAGKIAEHLKLSSDGPSYEAVRTVSGHHRPVLDNFAAPPVPVFCRVYGHELDSKTGIFLGCRLFPRLVPISS